MDVSEQAVHSHIEELEFLAHAGLHLLEMRTEADILAYVGEQVSLLLTGAIVFVSSFDPTERRVTVRYLFGEERSRSIELLGRDPVGMSFPVSDKYRQTMLPAKLNEVPNGICGLTFDQLPEDVCRYIEQQLNVKGVYGMPFAVREDLMGMLAFLSRSDPPIAHAHLIEAFVGEAAVAIQRHRAEQALRDSERRLRDADRRKDEFLAVLSHELRNPLAPIRNSLFVLEHAVPGSDQARRAQAVIGRQVTHLTRLVDDLLDVTRIARGKIQLHREQVDLGDLVRRSLEDHRAMFTANGIELVATVTAEPLCVKGDATRLAQAVGNLLSNAAKFTPWAGCVDVTLEREGASALLRVRDTGVGIAPDVLDQLFQPFIQAQQTLDRTHGGLGLGLALVKGLIESHDGSITAASEGSGRGAEFAVRLPLDVAAASNAATTPDESSQRASRRVLIIEDNIDAANSLREALELGKHTVAVALMGAEGIETARTFQPDVVLCDIGLPEMDGYTVARTIRRDPALSQIYLVAVTGYALPEDIEKAKEAGFDCHVAKPPDPSTIEELLARAPHSGAGKTDESIH